ncbi:MAG: hypothetical protein R2860_17165 [Desulfobacterales bacterium]
MSDHAGKRIAIRFCSANVINLIEELPRGYKSMMVESAVAAFLESAVGSKIAEQLKERKKKQAAFKKSSKSKKAAPKQSAPIGHITGDY